MMERGTDHLVTEPRQRVWSFDHYNMIRQRTGGILPSIEDMALLHRFPVIGFDNMIMAVTMVDCQEQKISMQEVNEEIATGLTSREQGIVH